ncbi:MAG: RNA polymerase sigma factor [Planctomycetota bacterium]|jgi:RNA polymerase sigma factor (sigma-70 family)
MDERSDAGLVRQALAGQREAFADLVRKYQDYAYGTAIAMVSDFDLARDVVQEAFLQAYRSLRKLREPARFSGWLHGIVKNTARRALRELERVRGLAGELGYTGEPFDAAPLPDRSAEDAEGRAMVRQALLRLSEKNREAVSLYYVDGLSYAEIAGYLGVTETAVQGRLQRGRRELKKELTMVAKTFKQEGLPDDFTEEIRRLFDAADRDSKQYEPSIRRLAEIGAPAVEPLCEALGDPRVAVRRAAACALCSIGDARSLGPILQVLYPWPFPAWRLNSYDSRERARLTRDTGRFTPWNTPPAKRPTRPSWVCSAAARTCRQQCATRRRVFFAACDRSRRRISLSKPCRTRRSGASAGGSGG